MRVEVIYASSAQSWVRRALDVSAGTTVQMVLDASGLLVSYPEINCSKGFGVAIYGVTANLTQTLREGDRVEIVRPLVVDPKEARRRRVRVRKARPERNQP